MNRKHIFTKSALLVSIAVVIFVFLSPLATAQSAIPVQANGSAPTTQLASDEACEQGPQPGAEDGAWTAEEIEVLHEALTATEAALDEAGFDGKSLIAEYRFRKHQGEFIDGVPGQVALARHASQEIVLGDAAFKRLDGFYIYHELGHVVDKKMDRQLTHHFHAQTGQFADESTHGASLPTADGFWLNEHAKMDQQESTADAFALWVTQNSGHMRPVFWNTPQTVSYELIVDTMDTALAQVR